MMIMRKNLILPVALVAALIGGSVGAFVVSRQNSSSTDTTVARTTPATYSEVSTGPNMQLASANSADQLAANNSLRFQTAQEQSAYREGFADGFLSARNANTNEYARTAYAPASSASRNAVYRTQARRADNSRRAYYDYGQPQPGGRSFWQKHRDKLTVGMGTGAGAVIGGLIGGKKGAGIGALAGAGGSALYTYKIRNKSRRY